jgi:hypothetical protein
VITDDNRMYDYGCPQWVLVLATVIVTVATMAGATLMYMGLQQEKETTCSINQG